MNNLKQHLENNPQLGTVYLNAANQWQFHPRAGYNRVLTRDEVLSFTPALSKGGGARGLAVGVEGFTPLLFKQDAAKGPGMPPAEQEQPIRAKEQEDVNKNKQQ